MKRSTLGKPEETALMHVFNVLWNKQRNSAEPVNRLRRPSAACGSLAAGGGRWRLKHASNSARKTPPARPHAHHYQT